MKHIIFFFLCIFTITAQAAPSASWYFDELGTINSSYTLNDSQANNDGTAYFTPSTGNVAGKICSALDFSAHSYNDFAVLEAASLSGASDFTISIWHKGSSANGRSLLSGARAGEHNELIMWFNSATRFTGYINGSASAAINIPSIADNQWHHIVWRRTANQSCLFTDGIQRGCVNIQSKVLDIESLVLAQEQDSLGGGFDINQDWEGVVDELVIFKNALSNAEIQTIYQHQDAGNGWDGSSNRVCQITPPIPPEVNVDYGYSDWHFDAESWNSSANEVLDSHGGQHGIAYGGVNAVPGKICNAMDLTKSSTKDYAKLGAGSLDGVTNFTISVWHKGASTLSKSLLSGANISHYNELIFWFSNNAAFNGHLKDASLGSVATSVISDDNWHQLVWRKDGVQSCFFFDAQLQGCSIIATSGSLSISSLILGQEQDSLGGGFSSSQDWEGIVDELLIFRRALDHASISSIYTHQNNGKNWDGSYRACPNMPAMKLTKTSMVISDPINFTTHPKRIPGAIIRYTIKAENAHVAAAENIVVRDDLTAGILSGYLLWSGNLKVTSPNINAGSIKSLTDHLGDDEGEFSNSILSVRCGDISDNAPCIVSYEVEITQ